MLKILNGNTGRLGNMGTWLILLCCLFVPVTAQATQYNASGTYTYNSGTGVLTSNTTTSNFTCEGPTVGTKTSTVTFITATTMIEQYTDGSTATWTRTSGTAGDITSTWSSSDAATGNSWQSTVNANGTFSVVGNIVQCGGGGGSGVQAYSQHWSNGYYAHFTVDDPSHSYKSVTVTGPYITNKVRL